MKRLLHILWLALPMLLLVPVAQAQTGSGVFGNVGVHSGGHMGVYGNLTAVSGYVVTPRPEPTANISWQPGASHSGTSDASHVNGYAEVVGNTAFTFPVGNGAVLRPAGMSAPPISGTYSVAYFSTNPSSGTLPTGGPFSTSALGSGVTGISPVEYWDINGPGAVNLTLSWDANSNLSTLTGGNLSSLIVAGWDGSKWVNLGGTATGTLSGTGTITTTTPVVPNTYTAYTFGTASTCATPTVGGLVSFAGSLPLCDQSNVGSLTLTGQTGDVVRWESSTNNGLTWQPIAGSAGKASYNFVNAQNSQQYRAVVNNGTGCADVSATSATLITSNTACQTALCDSRTGSLSINVVSQSNGSNITAQVVAVDLAGVIQAVSAPGGNGVAGLAPGTYQVYHVTFDNTQTPLPTLSVGTALSVVDGSCVQWSNGLLFGVCPSLPTVAITSPAPNTLLSSLTPPITGTATPGSSVTVTGGPGATGGPCIVTASNTGSWTCTSLTFTSGRNSVSAVAGNSAGRSPIATTPFVTLAEQTSFVCGTSAYLFQNPSGSPTDVISVNLQSGVGTVVAQDIVAAPNREMNALGYNTLDNFIWGYRLGTNQIVRIGAGWGTQVVTIPGLPTTLNFNVGDVGPDGVLYLYATSTTQIYRVDVNPTSPTFLTLLPSLTTTASGIADWSFSPVDGNMYSVDNTFQLLRFNPTTGARTVVGAVTGTAIRATDSGFGAAYMDLDGSLYLGNNANGQIFRIVNPHTGGLAATLFSVGPVSANNDGARCPAAPVVEPPTVAITGPAPGALVTTTTPPITGTATPGTPVTVVGPGGQLCSTTASQAGSWTCASLTFTPGSQTVTAIACSSVGCSTATTSFTVVAPPTLIVDPLPPTGPTTGTATPDAQIVITDPGGRTLCTTTASRSGTYSCPVTLPPSLTNVIVTACNLAGCTSQTVTPLPSLTVAPPVSPGPPTQPITGTANPGAQITITGPGPVTLCITTASSSGTFSCPVTLPPGETNLTVTACNSASCVTQPTSRTVIGPPVVIVDPVPPTGPITGTATPGVALTLTDPTGQTLCTTTASQSGTFSCPGPLPPSLTSVIVTACNVTSCVSTTAPVRPSLVIDPPVRPGPPTQPVTGTANPGAQITLTGPGPVTLCTTTASSSGTFSCPVTLPDGITTLTVTACNAGGCTSRPVTLTVAQPPVTMPDIANTNPGTPVTGNVLTNDRDPLGLPLTASLTTPPTVGTATLNPDGSYTYTPPTGFTGTTSFCYTASNTAGHSNSACVTVNVVPAPQSALANNAPVASNLNTQTTQAVPVTVNLLTNVSDPDNPSTANGQLNRPTLLSQPAQGTAVVNNDGTVTYTPPAGFTGIVSVPYQVCDKATSPLCSTALLTVNVQPTLPTGTTISPVATDGVLITPVNTPAMGTVATNSYDPQNLPLTYTAGQPQSGTVVMSSTGSYTFTPAPGFVGPVSFTYAACNSAGKCSPATVSVLVQPAPVGGLVRLNVRMLLQGALFNVGSGTLMRDDLRAGGYLPATSPYSASVSPRFSQSGGGGSETTTSAVLSVTGTNAIVDWVLVELRSAANPTLILATRSGLLQRDGDVVLPADGTSPLTFTGLTGNQYYVSVKHRNHLGVMTATALPLSSSGTVVDFSIMTSSQIYDQPGAVNYNGNEMVTVSGRQALWAGDANADGKVKYAGTASDLTTVLNEVITAQTGNSSPTYNYDFAFGYFWGDVDLNGKVKYQGSINDPTWIFSNVVATYILNTGPLYNYDFLVEQLP
ncbi:tandem-95 repeat protein [Rudanella paleaurantiibacter]|uniref:Tandem-95 repeat protein n=1 Tax=Rudanella paleaurantiibacter TaxID=2614655 RepID=A0A7J5TSN1_9BACT|nr:Ig-like domain-containing protein [Rudanella paleaurantiibacter]KAB7726501.1 tandem-95 repeat protein [Rudanella paleaurantiibacter]